MLAYLNLDSETKQILSWGSIPFPGAVEVEIDEEDPRLMAYSRYRYINDEFILDITDLLIEAKQLKTEEISKKCQEAILSGFTHMINSIEYQFSFDLEAQSNFTNAKMLLDQELVSEIMWTVRTGGSYTRIPINRTIMNELAITILNHKEGNVGRFREEIVPEIEAATSLEELEDISW